MTMLFLAALAAVAAQPAATAPAAPSDPHAQHKQQGMAHDAKDCCCKDMKAGKMDCCAKHKADHGAKQSDGHGGEHAGHGMSH